MTGALVIFAAIPIVILVVFLTGDHQPIRSVAIGEHDHDDDDDDERPEGASLVGGDEQQHDDEPDEPEPEPEAT